MEFARTLTGSDEAWREWHASNARIDEGAVTVEVDPALAYVSPGPVVADPPDPFRPVDGDVDGCGLPYALAPSGDLYRYDDGQSRLERLPCTWFEGGPVDPSALCVTDDSVFVADAGAGAVQAYSRHLLQTRWIAADGLDAPVALAATGDRLLVLDAGPGGEPDDGGEESAEGDGTAGDDGAAEGGEATGDGAGEAGGSLAVVAPGGAVETVLDGLDAPRDLAVDEAGRVLLLVRRDGADAVVRLDDAFEPAEVVRVPADLAPTCVEAGAGDEVLVGVDPASAVEPSLYRRHPTRGSFEPVDGISGPCWKLFVRRSGRPAGVECVYAVAGAVDAGADVDDRSLVRVEARRQRRRNPETDRHDARLVRRFDSGLGGTRWHRVTLDRTLDGANTAVRVRYVATDDADLAYDDSPTPLEAVDGIGPTYAGRLREAGVEDVEALVELAPGYVGRLAGTGSYDVSTKLTRRWLADARHRLVSADDVRGVEWSAVDGPNPADALLDDAVGRYLWVELELVGDRFAAPRVESFGTYAPRQSYLRHLPAVYREDEASAAFLERFLSIFESVMVGIEEDVDAASRFLHPDGVPAEYVDWLEGWLALEAEEAWPEAARRELLRSAPELFKKRGTREGLLDLLSIYLDQAVTRPEAGHLPGCDCDDAPDASGAGSVAVGGGPGAGGAGSAGAGADDDGSDGAGAGADAAGSDGAGAGADDDGDGPDAGGEDPLAFVVEHADFDCIDSGAAREPFERLVPCPQCYLVLVRSFLDDEVTETVARIVDSERPAHAVGRTMRLEPWIRLGRPAFLGVNSVLPSREFVLEEASLGADSVLAEREEAGQLDLHSRVGTDTIIS